MSFVLKLRYGLFIALATLLVGCPDDEKDKEGSVKLEIKQIANVAAGTGESASVSVEVTIKDGDEKITGDGAKAEVALKHKCGDADKFSGSDKATAASAVAKGSVSVPRPAADAEGESHKCKIQASTKIDDKEVTAESNEFTVAKAGADTNGATGSGDKEAKLAFESGLTDSNIVVGTEFVVENDGEGKGTVNLAAGCTNLLLFTVGDAATNIKRVEGTVKDTIPAKSGNKKGSTKFVVVEGNNTEVNPSGCTLNGVGTNGTTVVTRGSAPVVLVLSDDGNFLKVNKKTDFVAGDMVFGMDANSSWKRGLNVPTDSRDFTMNDSNGSVAWATTAGTTKEAVLCKFDNKWHYKARA